MTRQRAASYPDAASRADASPIVAPSGVINFSALPLQDPLSIGGTWSNNTQGVGGNVAPGNLASMRIALASDGATKIAQAAAAPVVDYDDSFAFLPGVGGGNLRITATVYRAAGYNPTANHELELILGCATSAGGNHRWIECLWSADASVDIINLDGQPNAFTPLGGSTGNVTTGPQDGDVWVAELFRATNRVRWLVNGVLAADVTNALIAGLGTGCGIAAFRRGPAFGTSDAGGLGFRNFKAETF